MNAKSCPTWIAELDSELRAYVNGNDLVHRLIWRVGLSGDQINEINETFRHREQECEAARSAGNWDWFMEVHERPMRFRVLEEIEPELSPAVYSKLFGDIWTESEEIWKNVDVIRRLLATHRPRRHHMLSRSEWAEFESLQEPICVYRGYSHDNANGLSWTISSEKARWFARKDADDQHMPMVVSGECVKHDVIAFFNRRNEDEVVIESTLVQKKTSSLVCD